MSSIYCCDRCDYRCDTSAVRRAQRRTSMPSKEPPNDVKTGVSPRRWCNRPYKALQRKGGKVNTSSPLPSFAFTLMRRKRISGIFTESGRMSYNAYPCRIITGKRFRILHNHTIQILAKSCSITQYTVVLFLFDEYANLFRFMCQRIKIFFQTAFSFVDG